MEENLMPLEIIETFTKSDKKISIDGGILKINSMTMYHVIY